MTSPDETLSTETAAFVRRHYGAFNQRDMRALLADLDAAIVFEETTSLQRPDRGVFTGHGAIEKYFKDLWEGGGELWTEGTGRLQIEPCETAQHGDELLVGLRLSIRHGETGQELDMRVWHLWTLRGGKATRVRIYGDRNSAFADLGLAPETGQPLRSRFS